MCLLCLFVAFQQTLNFRPQTLSLMSHFTTITTLVRDVAALRAAVAELGLQLLPDAEARGFASQTRRGDFVIRLKGPYDIALHRQPNDNYGLTTDWWNGHVEREVGKDFGRLLQLYGVHKTTLEARKKGLSVLRRQQPNGAIKLVLATL